VKSGILSMAINNKRVDPRSLKIENISQ